MLNKYLTDPLSYWHNFTEVMSQFHTYAALMQMGRV